MSNDPMSHHTRSIPILVDNSLNRAMSIKYALLSLFAGVSTSLTGLRPIVDNFGEGISFITTIVIFATCAVSSIAAWNSAKSVRWEKAELYSVITFVSFLTIWSGSAIWDSINGEPERLPGVFLSIMLCVIPIWRARYFIKKNRKN